MRSIYERVLPRLQRVLSQVLGVPILTAESERPAGVGAHGRVEFVAVQPRALNTTALTVRLTLYAPEESPEPLAQQVLQRLWARVYQDGLIGKIRALGGVEHAQLQETGVEWIDPRGLSVLFEVEVA